MAEFSLNEFKSQVLGKGLSRPNRFEVNIGVPLGLNSQYKTYGNIVNLLCEETNFPPLIINTKAYKIFGPSYQRPVSAEYGGEGISMTFHVDQNMFVKRFFEEWTYAVISKNTFLINYQEEYATIVEINQLDQQNKIVYSCFLNEAFPRSINVMPLNHSTQNQTHRLTVMFAYRSWTSSSPNEYESIITNTNDRFKPPVPFETRPTNTKISEQNNL
jgi:hypothetical protein